jgi:hypothetical protein
MTESPMKHQLWWILAVGVACLFIGTLVGGWFACYKAQVALRQLAEVVPSYRESGIEIRALLASRDLKALQALREQRVGDAIRTLEEGVEADLDYLSIQETDSELVAGVIADVRSYRGQKAPPPPPPRLPDDPRSAVGLFSSARLVPVYEPATVVGLRVTRIVPDSFWDQTGIRDGDIIVQVNDVVIDSAESGAKVLQILSSERNLQLDRSDPSRVRLRSSIP